MTDEKKIGRGRMSAVLLAEFGERIESERQLVMKTAIGEFEGNTLTPERALAHVASLTVLRRLERFLLEAPPQVEDHPPVLPLRALVPRLPGIIREPRRSRRNRHVEPAHRHRYYRPPQSARSAQVQDRKSVV